VFLKCTLPGCMKPGIDYYTATLSFEQKRIQRYTMRLAFVHDFPEWLRVYEWSPGRAVTLLKDLRPYVKSAGVCEYRDDGEEVPASSARIYVFSRPHPVASSPRLASSRRSVREPPHARHGPAAKQIRKEEHSVPQRAT